MRSGYSGRIFVFTDMMSYERGTEFYMDNRDDRDSLL